MTEEEKFIKKHYLSTPINQIARELNRSYTFVSGRMKKLGLKIPNDIMAERKKMTRFKRGNTPFNKGKKQAEYMSRDAIEKSKKTRYKKGNKPKNTLYDFAIRKRFDKSGVQYYFIRIKEAKWELLHRYIWKLYNGDIPNGYNIQFKDGDTMNCTIDNLFIISKKEQVRINKSGGKKIDFELYETILTIQKINQKIKSYEKQDNRP